MRIPKNILDILIKEKYYQLATCSKDGIPNICTVGAYFIKDKETIIIVDNYMRKTFRNVVGNPNVAILVRKEKESFQLKGKCIYKEKGREYEKARKWMRNKGRKYPAKGILIIKVEKIYDSRSGQNAGKELT